MTESNVILLRRNQETATQVERILELPNERWTDIEISFGTESIATCTVTLVLTAEQLTALVAAGTMIFVPESGT